MHFDLWPAPMRAGLCALRRLSIRGGVASTPAFGGRPEAKQRPCHFVKATRRGAKPRRGSHRHRRDVEGRDGSKKKFCTPHFRAAELIAGRVNPR